MKQTLTRSQMLERWKTLRAVEPSRLDCTLHRTDGPDIDTILTAEMRSWYLDLLDRADPRLLAPANVASEAQTESASGANLCIVTPPEGTRRVLSLSFDNSVPVVPGADADAVIRMAANRFWRRTMAARLPDGSILVAAPGKTLTGLTAVVDPGPETYEFDDSIWKETTF